MGEKLMVVRMLTSIAGPNFEHHPGELAEVPEIQGRGWISGGVAEAAPKAELERQRREKAEAAAKEAGGEVAALEAEIAKREQVLADAASRIGALEAEIAQRDVAIADLGKRIAERDERIATLETELAAKAAQA
jgi:chromosome segregation ATPase